MDRTRRDFLVPASLAITVVILTLACSRADTGQPDTAHPDSEMIRFRAGVDTPTTLTAVSCVVADSAIGPIRLGMTLAEAKVALPPAKFERGYDGDGAASVGVVVGGDSLMTLVADDDEDAAIDWTRPIRMLETFSPLCRTADGVHPGSLVLDAEKVLGKTTKIVQSEIESREYIEFERQPAGLTFRLDYTGIFPEGSRETRRFDPAGRIFSIAISSF